MTGTLLRHILLVAGREFRQIIATRGFWLTLLVLPISMAVPLIVQRLSPPDQALKIMLVDPEGKEAPAIRTQLETSQQRAVLAALARYAERYNLQKSNPAAPWAHNDRLYSDTEVQAFVRAGGEKGALAAMAPATPPDTPDFDTPKPHFILVPTPPEIATASPQHMTELARARVDPPQGKGGTKISHILYIPPGFGAANVPVRLWTSGTPDRELIQTVQGVLTRDLRLRFLENAGTPTDVAKAAGGLAPMIAIDAPPPGGGREKVVIRSVLPLIAAFMLLMSLVMSGAWMLQGMIEERSNKLLESMLACVTPDALMYGKLIGTVATGLLMIAVWIGFAVGYASATQGVVADFLRPALASVSSVGVVAAMLYFFVMGYVLVAMFYLAVGSLSDSARDAQSSLMPITLAIFLPFSFVANGVLNDNITPALQVMSWIPIWTPFIMLARLGSGVPLWELLGSGAVLAVFIVLEFLLLGRVFRASLLSTGQRASLANMIRLARVREG